MGRAWERPPLGEVTAKLCWERAAASAAIASPSCSCATSNVIPPSILAMVATVGQGYARNKSDRSGRYGEDAVALADLGQAVGDGMDCALRIDCAAGVSIGTGFFPWQTGHP